MGTDNDRHVKVVIVGVGAVGATSAYTPMISGFAQQMAPIDMDRKRAEGEAMDLSHGLFFAPPVDIPAGDYADCGGATQKPEEVQDSIPA